MSESINTIKPYLIELYKYFETFSPTLVLVVCLVLFFIYFIKQITKRRLLIKQIKTLKYNINSLEHTIFQKSESLEHKEEKINDLKNYQVSLERTLYEKLKTSEQKEELIKLKTSINSLENRLNDTKNTEIEQENIIQKNTYYNKDYCESQTQTQELQKLSFEDKLNLIANANLETKNPLNFQEAKIFKELIFEQSLREKFSIFPQVAMKSFIQNKNDDESWKTYSNSYVDFLIAKRDFKNNRIVPFAVIEFHGGWHYGKDNPSAEIKKSVINNDKIKEEILKKVNIKLFVIKDIDVYDALGNIDKEKLKLQIGKIAKELS